MDFYGRTTMTEVLKAEAECKAGIKEAVASKSKTASKELLEAQRLDKDSRAISLKAAKLGIKSWGFYEDTERLAESVQIAVKKQEGKRNEAPAKSGPATPKFFSMPAHNSGSAPAEHARETKACTDRGMRLCTYQELCPKGCGDKTYQDKGHSWVPYSGFNGDYSNNGNSWVFIGTDGGHPSCRDHNGNRKGNKSVCGIANPNWNGDRYGNGMYCCAKNGKEMATELVEQLPAEHRRQDIAMEEDAILQEVWS